MTGLHRVGRAADVPAEGGLAALVGDRAVAVFRAPHGWVAVDGECPHLGGPLAEGTIEGDCVRCPLHGWTFDLATGREVSGAGGGRLARHEVVERDGELFVRLSGGERSWWRRRPGRRAA